MKLENEKIWSWLFPFHFFDQFPFRSYDWSESTPKTTTRRDSGGTEVYEKKGENDFAIQSHEMQTRLG